MRTRLAKILVISTIVSISACSASQQEPQNNATISTPHHELPEYKILDDTVKEGIKRTVEVELPSRTDEPTLRELSDHIRSLSEVSAPRTYIGYRIAGSHHNQGFWATAHYDPNLVIKILGEHASTHEQIARSPLPTGEIIGTWLANWGYEYKITAYIKDGKTYIRRTYASGAPTDTPFQQSKTNSGIKLQDDDGKENGEYFIINPQGELEFWSENGNYYTAPKS